MELTRSAHGITLFQRKYALQIIEDTGLSNTKPVSCPLDPVIKLQKHGSDLYRDPTAMVSDRFFFSSFQHPYYHVNFFCLTNYCRVLRRLSRNFGVIGFSGFFFFLQSELLI